MKAWLQAQCQCEEQGLAYVLISVCEVQGSSPRNVGAKMLVTEQAQFDTIGGGHLEHKAVKYARSLLRDKPNQQTTALQHYALGASLGQCCGGQVTLLYEQMAVSKMPVVIFGAGHVGRALVPVLASLPVAITWVDSRYDMLPKQVPTGVNCVHEEHPVDAIDDCLPGSCYLIMTHHHGLDLQLAAAALKRGDGRYVGVIGSRTKAARFRHRLLAKGLAAAMPTFHCPMGEASIKGKLPMEVAISVAATVIKLYQQMHDGAALQTPVYMADSALKASKELV
ncbi:MAG: xanthine dehydrogenase accessory protein XdhC [Gammaproteobacteria bacterium]|jgi:xanthine dehydrogenase accessory factor|nr:xanthine dehydrogenase accessory protein XdhC [Gammaproteobacteria bacterium]